MNEPTTTASPDGPKTTCPCASFAPPDTHHDIATIHRAILCKTCGHALGMHVLDDKHEPSPSPRGPNAPRPIGEITEVEFQWAEAGFLVEREHPRHKWSSHASLLSNATALLALDAAGKLVPHGIGGHARRIIEGFLTLSEQTVAHVTAKPEPAGALKAIMAAADLRPPTCFHVQPDGRFCGHPSVSEHGTNIGHPFVSLSTLLRSVAELASANLRSTNAKPHARTQSAPAEAYRLLEAGEIIQEGDQCKDDEGQWRNATQLGIGLTPGFTENEWRRPITGGAGLHEAATVSQVDKIRDDGTRFIEDVIFRKESPPASRERALSDIEPHLPEILERIEKLEECGLLLSELPPAEARLVIGALATVFSV